MGMLSKGRGLRKHPHGRGEDVTVLLPFVTVTETPPRAWGRLTATHTAKPFTGNTPTGVGKTYFTFN